MKERPILMQTEMVQSTMDDQKSVTRRLPGLEYVNAVPDRYEFNGFVSGAETTYALFRDINARSAGNFPQKCPYGKRGDVLWVRETFSIMGTDIIRGEQGEIIEEIPEYVFRGQKRPHVEKLFKWKPSIHMPKTAARLWLEVKEISVERLQDITEEDAIAEGVVEYEDGSYKNYFRKKGMRTEDGVECYMAKGSFQTLICQINGMGIWKKNPWVWVVRYKVLSKSGKPLFKNINAIDAQALS